MKKFLTILAIMIVVSACSDKEQTNNPAQAQIDEYSSTVNSDVSSDVSNDVSSDVSEQDSDCNDDDESQKDSGEDEKGEGEKEKMAERSFSIEEDDIVIGDPNSKVVVMEYFAMTCPHCYGFLKRTYPEIKSKYIDTKKVAYVFREFVGNK